MLPVVLDAPQHYDLARFGHPAGIVIEQRRAASAALPYVVSKKAADGRWIKVVVRARVELPEGRRPRGFAHLTAVTDGRVSASIELEAARGGAVRWQAVSLHGRTSGKTRSRTVRVRLTNYVRIQGARPGRHTLRFRLRRFHGFQVSRVVIEPRSGLLVTRQPPQPLRGQATVTPAEPIAGSHFEVRLRVTNTGILPARRVRLVALAEPGLRPLEPLPRIGPIPPGGIGEATLAVEALAPGEHLLQVLTESNVGQDLRELPIRVAASGSTAGAGLPAGDSPPLGPIAALAGALTAVLLARRLRRRVA